MSLTKYIKKADKTPSSDEVETRQRVQEILQQIENSIEQAQQAPFPADSELFQNLYI